MTRRQVFILIGMGLIAIILFGAMVALSQPLLEASPQQVAQGNGARETIASATFVPTMTPTPTNSPTVTPTPTTTETGIPTPTNPRVVIATPIPTDTPTPTATRVPVISTGGGSSGGSSLSSGLGVSAGPSARPTSTFEYTIVTDPIEYETTNNFFAILARVTAYNTPVGGYRLMGVHSPSGITYESPPACGELCKASSPDEYTTSEGVVVRQPNQDGNLFFEAPFYETGVWTIQLIAPNGGQASDTFRIDVDAAERVWVYMHFSATRTEDPAVSAALQPPTPVPPCQCEADFYTCDNFQSQAAAQNCYNWCIGLGAGDVHNLDSFNPGDTGDGSRSNKVCD
jgi:hypothetical protein